MRSCDTFSVNLFQLFSVLSRHSLNCMLVVYGFVSPPLSWIMMNHERNIFNSSMLFIQNWIHIADSCSHAFIFFFIKYTFLSFPFFFFFLLHFFQLTSEYDANWMHHLHDDLTKHKLIAQIVLFDKLNAKKKCRNSITHLVRLGVCALFIFFPHLVHNLPSIESCFCIHNSYS